VICRTDGINSRRGQDLPGGLSRFYGFIMKAGAAVIMKIGMVNVTKESKRRTGYILAILLCCLSSISCLSPGRHEPHHGPAKDDLSVYRVTDDQAGHEFVKTEEFLVPVGSVIVITGLEFEPGASALTRMHERIVQQIFNSIEEITENTVGDTNGTRVRELKDIQFEIRGYPDDSGGREGNVALSEERAKAVLNLLTYLGTPQWRLKATGLGAKGRSSWTASQANRKTYGRVEFVRTR
jgi:outer membrane protein OmpA-like peptidoglycan-associated protein